METPPFLEVLDRIKTAEILYKRTPQSVNLLAVSKSQSLEKIKALIKLGQKSFGENYVDEALTKMKALHNENLVWHFIGVIQSNKTKLIAEHFSWVHSLSKIHLAKRLNDARPKTLDPLNVCIQINISKESSKSGVLPEELYNLAKNISQFPRLRLRGLMVIPKFSADFKEQFEIFQEVAKQKQHLVEKGFELDTLSMGMSNDFEAAIAAGSTWVRIGTAIFGPREN